MKNTLFCLFIFCSVSTFAQNGITFKVEKLSKPEELLHLHSPNEIYESLILSDMDIEPYEIKEKNIKVPYHIIAKSESPDRNCKRRKKLEGRNCLPDERKKRLWSPHSCNRLWDKTCTSAIDCCSQCTNAVPLLEIGELHSIPPKKIRLGRKSQHPALHY